MVAEEVHARIDRSKGETSRNFDGPTGILGTVAIGLKVMFPQKNSIGSMQGFVSTGFLHV